MDNVTHTLAGMLAAEAALVGRRESRPHVRAAAYLASALANNLPDSDILYTWITSPKPLGSLLHHRGHTHTLLLAVPMAWLLGLGLWRWLSRRPDVTARDRSLILGLSLLGPLLHLGLDFGNNYGVHPFWPLSNAWFYGDTIFIIEPLWWALTIPILAQAVRRVWLKVVLWLLLAAALVLAWYVPFVLTASLLALVGASAGAFAVGRLTSERTRLAFAVGSWAVVAALFAVGSRGAKSQLQRATVAAFPALRSHDMAVTPLPANPACWEALVVGEQGGTYRVLRATVALWPLGASECTAGLDSQPTAAVTPLERPVREGVRWVSEYRAELSQLRKLAREDCRFRALLKFARLPYHSRVAAGNFAGDLRYDRQPALDFSDLALPSDPRTGECPRWIPGWVEPRAELLQP